MKIYLVLLLVTLFWRDARCNGLNEFPDTTAVKKLEAEEADAVLTEATTSTVENLEPSEVTTEIRQRRVAAIEPTERGLFDGHVDPLASDEDDTVRLERRSAEDATFDIVNVTTTTEAIEDNLGPTLSNREGTIPTDGDTVSGRRHFQRPHNERRGTTERPSTIRITTTTANQSSEDGRRDSFVHNVTLVDEPIE